MSPVFEPRNSTAYPHTQSLEALVNNLVEIEKHDPNSERVKMAVEIVSEFGELEHGGLVTFLDLHPRLNGPRAEACFAECIRIVLGRSMEQQAAEFIQDLIDRDDPGI
jgi:hypothetical protein